MKYDVPQDDDCAMEDGHRIILMVEPWKYDVPQEDAGAMEDGHKIILMVEPGKYDVLRRCWRWSQSFI